MPKITFKVDTTAKKYGMKYRRNKPGARSTVVMVAPDTAEEKTLDPGDYLADWVFWGPDNATFKLTISGSDGSVIKVCNDKMKPGKGFEHDLDHFEIS